MERRDMAIEDALIWAFMREKVQLARLPGLGITGRPVGHGFPHTDPVARIGCGGHASLNLGFDAPADAYVLQDAVHALPRDYAYTLPAWCLSAVNPNPAGRIDLQQLVMRYAATGTRPDYCEHPRPLAAIDGGPVYDMNNHRALYSVVLWSGDPPETVMRIRTRFLVWRIALETLRNDLKDCRKFRALRITDDLPEIPA